LNKRGFTVWGLIRGKNENNKTRHICQAAGSTTAKFGGTSFTGVNLRVQFQKMPLRPIFCIRAGALDKWVYRVFEKFMVCLTRMN